MRMKSLRKGFTLIELMLVVIIIGVLIAMVMPRLAGRSEQARRIAAKADIESNLAMALDMYELDIGGYPTTDQGLKALIERPANVDEAKWNGPYLKKRQIPKDPWGTEYRYKASEDRMSYELRSCGPNRSEGDSDDITNLPEEEEGAGEAGAE